MEFKVLDLGLVDFQEAWESQKKSFLLIRDSGTSSTIVFCRHNPVITLGRSAKISNILASREELSSRSVKIEKTGRGGDITYHGPGQITVYPLINLNYFKKDVHFFLRCLEDIIISSLEKFRVIAGRIPGATGVWVGDKKIASIGISVKNWITFHGLSINISKGDLENFKLIRPCGMDIEMTSVETVLDKGIDTKALKEEIIANFYRVLRPEPVFV